MMDIAVSIEENLEFSFFYNKLMKQNNRFFYLNFNLFLEFCNTFTRYHYYNYPKGILDLLDLEFLKNYVTYILNLIH